MLHSILSYGLLALLAIALLHAMRTDLAERRIANWLNAAIALGAPLFWYATGLDLWPGVGIQLALATTTFLVALGLFAIGQMGGGDVKLLAALALWFPPGPFLGLVLVMALGGYALTMAYGVRGIARASIGSRARDIVTLAGLGIVSLAMGAQIIGFEIVPLPQSVALAAEQSALLHFALMQLPILGLVVCTVLALRLFRLRKIIVETPYGVAIAGAGLMVIASQLSLSPHFN